MTNRHKLKLYEIQQQFIYRIMQRASDFDKAIAADVVFAFEEALDSGLNTESTSIIRDTADDVLQVFYQGVTRSARQLRDETLRGRPRLDSQYVEQDLV